MDNDSAPEFVQKDDYIVAHNCRVQKNRDGMAGAIKPLASTIGRTAATTETTSVIGAINDDPNQRVFFFRWSITNDHRIICWNRRTNTALTVLKQADVVDGLGFGQFSYITGVAMIGDYLYWCDGVTNQPRRIDVERALRANNPTYISPDGTNPIPYTFPLNPWDITVARRVPIYPPKVEKLISAEEADIPDRAITYLDRNALQFAIRYVYRSGEYSTLGPYSKILPHNADQRFDTYVYKYDTVRVDIDKDEPIDNEVRIVEFLVRRDNIGSWYIAKSFDREEDPATFTEHNTVGGDAMGFYFYNDESGIGVADSESYVSFYDVPLFSNGLDVANNRLFTFNNVKGYDYVKDAVIAAEIVEHTWPANTVWQLYGSYYLFEWSCGTGIAEAVLLRVGEEFGPACGWYSTPYTSAQFNSNSLLTTLVVDPNDKIHVVDNDPDFKDIANHLNPTCQTYDVTLYATAQPTLSGIGPFSENAIAFRHGKAYKLGVQFYDYAGRNSGVAHNPVEVAIPERVRYEDTYTVGIQWTIGNTPGLIPLWAHSYSIVMNRAVESFVAGTSFPLYGTRNEEDGTWSFDDGGTPPVNNTTYLGSYDGIGLSIARMTGFRGIGYTFSEGDVVKIVNELDEVYYMKVIGVYLTYLILELRDIGDCTSSYFEIITPRKEDEDIFWEVGRNFKVINPGATTRSLSVTTGVVNGDTYFTRQEGRPEIEPIPAMNPSDRFWFLWPQNYGRPTKLLFGKQQRYETDLHPSGPFFPGTETNQLNAFLSGENKQLDLAIGFGQRLVLASRTQEYGTVMLAIGKTEVASIYLGRTEFFNADETPNVLRSTNVIGNVNILKGGFGTLNPESCFKNDGDVYWFSAIKSSFVRYAKDGVNPISDRKMSSFAAWLGNAVLTSASDIPGQAGVKVIGGFDDYHKEALWAIPPIGNWPIAFNTLDAIAEDLAITEPTLGNMSAAIVPGEIYRFSINFNAPVTVNATVWDYHFGQKTFVGTSNNPSFMFVGRPGSPTTITVTTTPPLSTLVYKSKLERMRPYPYSAIDRVPKTIAFSENNGRWSHTSSHTPEWFSKIGDQLVTFRGGVLFTHDSTSVGTFYGVQFPAWVSSLFSMQPNLVKRPQAFSVESDIKPNYVHFRTEEPNVQSTDLVSAQITSREGIHSAGVQRDRLSPNTAGTVLDKMASGDPMRGRVIKALFEWPKTTKFVAKIINLSFRDSSGHRT